MNINDLIIILIIATLAGVALWSCLRRKHLGCGGRCSGCNTCSGGCGASCRCCDCRDKDTEDEETDSEEDEGKPQS